MNFKADLTTDFPLVALPSPFSQNPHISLMIIDCIRMHILKSESTSEQPCHKPNINSVLIAPLNKSLIILLRNQPQNNQTNLDLNLQISSFTDNHIAQDLYGLDLNADAIGLVTEIDYFE